MDLKNEVLAIVDQAAKGLTVSEVADELRLRIEGEIRPALKALDKEGKITSNRGAGGYRTTYHRVPLKMNRRI